MYPLKIRRRSFVLMKYQMRIIIKTHHSITDINTFRFNSIALFELCSWLSITEKLWAMITKSRVPMQLIQFLPLSTKVLHCDAFNLAAWYQRAVQQHSQFCNLVPLLARYLSYGLLQSNALRKSLKSVQMLG